MMKHAAEEATFIIPVVTLKTVNTGLNTMWAQWTKTLHQKRWRKRIPVVVVTKALRRNYKQKRLDVIQHAIATKVWETGKQSNRVLFCDSLIGLGAMQLERLFTQYTENQDQEIPEWRPEYSLTLAENIQNPSSPMYHVLTFRSGCQIND